MILLDYNIPKDQVAQLRRVRLRPRQIGHDVGRPEWQDLQEILRYLHHSRNVTFCTRDLGFFARRLCYENYCLIVVAGPVLETATMIRQALRHRTLRTWRQRMGRVLQVDTAGIRCWQRHQARQERLDWCPRR